MSLLSPGISGTDAVNGLSISATHDVYFAAEDLESNLQASPQLVTSAPVAPVSQFATGGFAWGTASAWSAVTLGPYNGPWGGGNNAVFEATAGVVPVVSGTIVNNMTFSSGNFILQGGQLSLIGTTQPTITVSAGIPRLEGAIAGTQGFIKSGSGTLQMTGSNTALTGGIVISESFLGDNGGALGTVGLNNNPITANGRTVGLTVAGGATTDGGITLTSGTLRISNNNSSFTVNGAVTGSGGIELNKTGGGSNTLNLNSTSNTFTGGVDYTSYLNVFLNVNSFANSGTFGTGNIRFGVGAGADRSNRFNLQSGATSPLELTNPQFELTGGNNYIAEIFNNSAQAFTIDSDLLVSGTNNKRLTLGGYGAGINTFSGDIGNGSATPLNLTKAGSGTWVLSGDNTYNGTTTVTGGTLALVGGSQTSPITVNNGTKLGFTLGSPTTSTAGLTLGGTSTITITGTPDGTSDYLLMTATSITGTPVLDPPAAGYSIEVQGSGTQLVLVAPAPSTTLVIDLGTGTVIEGGAFGTFGATNLPLPPLPVGSILRSVSVDAAITATDNENFASDLAILFDPTPGNPGGDFSLRMTTGAITFGTTNQLTWSGGTSGPPATLVDTKTAAQWAAVGSIDLATYGIFLGNAYQDTGWAAGQGGTWSGTITLTYDLVGGGNPFDTWATTGTLGPVTFAGDTNGDGVQDGMAFLLGVANPDDDANGSLPTVSEVGGDLVMTFNCLPTADRGTAELRVAHSNTLASFTATVDQVPDANDAVPDNDVTFVVDTVSEAPLNKITATISSASAGGGKLFGRLTALDDVAPE